MEFTGERYVPSVDGKIRYEHALALALARGKSVLDIAFGESFASALLAQVAKSVVGVDLAASAKTSPQRRYYRNLKFMAGSSVAIPLQDASVEVVTSFETIEHQDKLEEMMLEIKRVLRPGGLLIISSPNCLISSDELNFVSQPREKELGYNRLMELLRRHFKHLGCNGQRLAIRPFVFSPIKTSATAATVCPLPVPAYFLAVCSDASLPDAQLDSVDLSSKDEFLRNPEAQRLNHIYQLQLRVRDLQGTISAKRTASQSRLAQSAEGATRHREQLPRCEGQLDQNAAGLVGKRTESTSDENRLALQTEQLAQQAERFAKQAGELTRARDQVTSYKAQLHRQSETLGALEARLSLRAIRSAQQARELASRDEELRVYRSQLDKLSESLTNVHAELSFQQMHLARQAGELAEANSRKTSAERRLNDAEAHLNDANAQLIKKSEVLDWMQTSRASRLIVSIRRLERFVYRIRQRFRRQSAAVFRGQLDPIEGLNPVAPKLNVSGWVFSKAATVTRVEAFLNDQFLGSLDYAIERDEPQEFCPDDFPGRCGFAGTFLLQGTIPEPRILTIRAFDARGNKELFTCTLSETGASVPNSEIMSLRGSAIESFALNTSSEPLLSIIIPVFNQWIFTLNCLRSIREVLQDSHLKAEVIVVDDCSTDDTQEMLERVTGVRVIANDQNSGFIDSSNRGAAVANGEYLLFLNNDTIVRNGCFEELLETFRLKPDAGLVGAKLLYPDGRLQEAGGIIWKDASGWNYGRLDDPEKPEYCYLREVDYCSGACIAVPKLLFQKLGGFDTYYRPAYCEDSDLAFRIREAGFKVYFQPLAQVVHFEGITSGTDTSQSIKSYQVVNQQKFFERWSEVLVRHGENGANPYAAKERRVRKRILVLDACMLTPDQDAGSLTVFNHIKIFQSLGYKVTFAPDNLHRQEKYTANLQRIGIECLYWEHTRSIKSHLEAYGSYYDLVFIARVGIAQKHIDDVRTYCSRAKIIFDTEDLHFVREQRQAELENNAALAQSALQRKAEELAVADKADCTIVVSSYEREVLLRENPRLNVSVVPIPRDMPGRQQDFAQRSDLLFIGGFQHPPNVDAVQYFVGSIYPLIKVKLPDVKFYIVGSKPPAEVLDLASDGSIIVTDYVADVTPYFNQCRLSIAPLRYGAGLKGKVITSLSYGLPMVASDIACEGIGLQDEVNVLIANDPSEFAEKVVRLYTDAGLWDKLSSAGFEKVSREYSEAATRSFFERLFASLEQPTTATVARR